MTSLFAGGIAISTLGLISAFAVHQKASHETVESRIGRIRKLSAQASMSIQNIGDEAPKEARLLWRDLISIYFNSRQFLVLGELLAEGASDDEIVWITEKLRRSHEKLLIAIIFTGFEKITAKLVRSPLRVYSGAAAWFYQEQLALLDNLSSACHNGGVLANALEAL